MTDLKPCPFCGSPAEIDGGHYYGYYVQCADSECGCAFGFPREEDSCTPFKTPEEAADAWNKRATL